MIPEDINRIRHMLDAVREALTFTKGKTRAALDDDRMLTLAIIKELEIIGEAAGKISAGTKSIHPEIPWIDIVGMRNRLIHGYFDIDLDLVWNTVLDDLESLQKQLTAVLEQTL